MTVAKSEEQRRLEGYPDHRPPRAAILIGGRINPDELDSVKPPPNLTPMEGRAWRDLIAPLVAGGMLDRVDLTIVELAAQALARVRQARAAMKAEHTAILACIAARNADPEFRKTKAHPGKCLWCEATDGEISRVASSGGLLAPPGTNSQGRVAHPAIAIEKGAMTEFRLLAGVLGIGPGSRVKLAGDAGAGSLRSPHEGGMAGELARQLPPRGRLRVVGDDADPD
jgi:phage terminase small subunit